MSIDLRRQYKTLVSASLVLFNRLDRIFHAMQENDLENIQQTQLSLISLFMTSCKILTDKLITVSTSSKILFIFFNGFQL